MKLKDGFVLKKIAGDTVVIPSGDTLDFNMMITLNDTGTFLWQMLEKGATEEELLASMLEEYEVDEETARTHIAAFVERLKENELLA